MMLNRIYGLYKKANRRLEKKLFKVFYRRSSFVPYYPFAIYIDATTQCNLKCEMCALYNLPESQKGNLSFENFRRMVRMIPNSRSRLIEFPGRGEPLLNPEIIKILKYAKERGFKTCVYTNGTLINKTNVKELASYVDFMHFSVSGAKKETYESIHRGARFDKLMNNIFLFVKTRTELKTQNRVIINFVASNQNYLELSDMVTLARELNVNKLTINIVRRMNPEKKSKQYDNKIKELQDMDKEELAGHLERASCLSEDLGVKLDIQPAENRWKNCEWPWRGCFITHDGFVTPCCLVTSPEIVNFGNVFDKNFRDIWNGSEYRRFRRLLLSNSPPKCCIKCGL